MQPQQIARQFLQAYWPWRRDPGGIRRELGAGGKGGGKVPSRGRISWGIGIGMKGGKVDGLGAGWGGIEREGQGPMG